MNKMQNLHRISGSIFINEKPGLCELCKHRKPYTKMYGFKYLCEKRQQVISAPKNVKKPRCSDFESTEMQQGKSV